MFYVTIIQMNGDLHKDFHLNTRWIMEEEIAKRASDVRTFVVIPETEALESFWMVVDSINIKRERKVAEE